MLKVSDVVKDIVNTSEFALEGLSNGCLNLSAYASSIMLLVEAKTKKPVHIGSIVAALRRLSAAQAKSQALFTPEIKAYNLVSRSGLAEIAYIKTPLNQKRVSQLYAEPQFTNSQFLVMTSGLGEISIITTEELAHEIKTLFGPERPKLFLKNLASLSMQTDETVIHTPNQFYTIIKSFALQRINIIEFITTFTEISFILEEKDLKQSFNILHDTFFIRNQ